MKGKYQFFNLYPPGCTVTVDDFQDLADPHIWGKIEAGEVEIGPDWEPEKKHPLVEPTIYLPKRSRFMQRWIRHKTGDGENADGQLARIMTPDLMAELVDDAKETIRVIAEKWVVCGERIGMISPRFPEWPLGVEEEFYESGRVRPVNDVMDMREALPVLYRVASHKGVILYYEST